MTSAHFQMCGKTPWAIDLEELNIERIGRLRKGAQTLRIAFGISSGPADLCTFMLANSYSTCCGVIMNSLGIVADNSAKFSAEISSDTLLKDSAIRSAKSAPRLNSPSSLWYRQEGKGGFENLDKTLMLFHNFLGLLSLVFNTFELKYKRRACLHSLLD